MELYVLLKHYYDLRQNGFSLKEKRQRRLGGRGGRCLSKKDSVSLETINDLMERGKKRGMLTYREIMDTLQDVELNPDQIDEIYESFSAMGIDVVAESSDDGEDLENTIVDEDEETDTEQYDLSIPEGVGIDDPVRMYLKEIGRVPLHRGRGNRIC